MKKSEYSLTSAELYGWGEGTAPDKERVYFLKNYIFGKRVLDVGCGLGAYTDFLANLGLDAWGIDFTKQFVDFCQKNKRGHFLVSNADKLPFKEEFDSCILFDILEHGDDKKILLEAKRVTKKRILIAVPKTVDKSLASSGVVYRHYIDKTHLREYEKKDIENLAKEVGLKVKIIKEVHPLYNETIFMSLFEGPLIFKKIIRKLVFLILPKKIYHTEIFAVFEK